MSCAACAARVEKAVSKVKGVTSCTVNLLTNSMAVEGNASESSITSAVKKAGYSAKIIGTKKQQAQSAASAEEQKKLLEDSETEHLKKRLACSAVFLCALMYFSMGHTMWNWPLPQFFQGNPAANGILQLLLASAILFINRKFFISGTKSLFHGAPNMDTLVALGSGASFAYSLAVLFIMTDALAKGNGTGAQAYLHGLYFESAAMIVTLITVGKLLESVSKGKTTSALKGLLNLAPESATVIRNGTETVIPADEILIGDIFIVKPGEKIPADGTVIEGESSVNESALTGESIPSDKSRGSTVTSATLNINGFLKCKAEKVGQDTTLSQIIQLVSDSAATKAPIAKTADKVSGIFVPSVVVIAAASFLAWILAGAEFSFALSRAISVLVISCPCALGLATPVAIMVANGIGAKNGILFKTSAALEETGRIKTVALDKTGTVTKGEPEVTDIVPADGISERELLQAAVSLEAKSGHPLAKAVVSFNQEKQIISKAEFLQIENFTSLPGNGLSGTSSGTVLFGGSVKFIGEKCSLGAIKETAAAISSEGKTPLLFCSGNQLLGLIAVADVLKEDSPAAIEDLQSMGINTVLITGDNEQTAQAIGKKAGVKSIISEVLPDGKEQAISQLKASGKTAMVGDGINDAPALTAADVGIAIGAGSDIAIDAADIVLMKNSLRDVPAAIRLSRKTLQNIRENLFWAFFYNIAGIPLAAGAYYHAFGWSLNPMFAAAAMSLSSFCVVTNSLRLNFFNPHKLTEKNKKQKEAGMAATEKIISVEGLKCSHCEAHVKEALEKIKGVEEASASHEKGEVVLKLSKEVDEKKLRAAVEKAGYKFIG